MQVTDRKIHIKNSTLSHLIIDLKEECQTVIALINQLELSNLTDNQKGDILAELLVSATHVNSHCDQNL